METIAGPPFFERGRSEVCVNMSDDPEHWQKMAEGAWSAADMRDAYAKAIMVGRPELREDCQMARRTHS
jgi:hypothetical protein